LPCKKIDFLCSTRKERVCWGI